MDPISEGDKIFAEVAKTVQWTETKSIDEAAGLLLELREKTSGLVIIDFLDSGNWDCLDGIEVNKETGILNLHWRDYRESQETEEEKEARSLAFPAALYSSLMKFRELRILDTGEFPVFVVRGYAMKDKEIKQHLSDDMIEFKLMDNQDNFSKLAVRKTSSCIETYYCLNTPIFSMIIIPKNCGISAFSSKKALLQYNLIDALVRLQKVKDELEREDLDDEDIISEKATSVRRIFEYVLKVELCYRYQQVTVKKDYSDLLLGDLMKLVKPFRKEAQVEMLRQITVWSNELAHESGKPITKDKALAVTVMTILYTQLLQSEMKVTPYPRTE